MSAAEVDLKALRRAVEMRPGDPDGHVALVLGLVATAHDEASQMALTGALDTALGALGRGWAVGQPDLDARVLGAFQRLEEAIPRGPLAVGIRLAHASLHAQRPGMDGAAERVIASLDDALTVEPPDGPTLMSAMALALHVDRHDAALRFFVAHPAHAREVLALAVVARLHGGDAAAAYNDGVAGLKDAPEDLLLLNATASAALALNQTTDAEALVARALAIAPQRPDVLLNAAAVHEQAGRDAYALGVLDGLAEAGQLAPVYETWREQLRQRVLGG